MPRSSSANVASGQGAVPSSAVQQTVNSGDVGAHIGMPTAAHAASAIVVTPVGDVAGVDSQAATAELDTEKLALTGGGDYTMTGPVNSEGDNAGAGTNYKHFFLQNGDGGSTVYEVFTQEDGDDKRLKISTEGDFADPQLQIQNDYRLDVGPTSTNATLGVAAGLAGGTILVGTATINATQVGIWNGFIAGKVSVVGDTMTGKLIHDVTPAANKAMHSEMYHAEEFGVAFRTWNDSSNYSYDITPSSAPDNPMLRAIQNEGGTGSCVHVDPKGQFNEILKVGDTGGTLSLGGASMTKAEMTKAVNVTGKFCAYGLFSVSGGVISSLNSENVDNRGYVGVGQYEFDFNTPPSDWSKVAIFINANHNSPGGVGISIYDDYGDRGNTPANEWNGIKIWAVDDGGNAIDPSHFSLLVFDIGA